LETKEEKAKTLELSSTVRRELEREKINSDKSDITFVNNNDHDEGIINFNLPSLAKDERLYLLSAMILPKNYSILIFSLHEHPMWIRCVQHPELCVKVAENASGKKEILFSPCNDI
jgi:hypothetical protein